MFLCLFLVVPSWCHPVCGFPVKAPHGRTRTAGSSALPAAGNQTPPCRSHTPVLSTWSYLGGEREVKYLKNWSKKECPSVFGHVLNTTFCRYYSLTSQQYEATANSAMKHTAFTRKKEKSKKLRHVKALKSFVQILKKHNVVHLAVWVLHAGFHINNLCGHPSLAASHNRIICLSWIWGLAERI